MAEDLSHIRRQYDRDRLDENGLLDDPLAQLEVWLEDAVKAELPDPTAMTIATVDSSGQPSQRIVLLKSLDEDGLVFYTNLGSRKAKELASNPKISAHFPWHFIDRQVKVCGQVERLSTKDVAKYFLSRPKESQLAAWASQQSSPISSRAMLMQAFAQVKEKFANKDISLPDFWGGFRIKAHEIEFWQGGEHRLHDRVQYTLDAEGGWQRQRLMP